MLPGAWPCPRLKTGAEQHTRFSLRLPDATGLRPGRLARDPSLPGVPNQRRDCRRGLQSSRQLQGSGCRGGGGPTLAGRMARLPASVNKGTHPGQLEEQNTGPRRLQHCRGRDSWPTWPGLSRLSSQSRAERQVCSQQQQAEARDAKLCLVLLSSSAASPLPLQRACEGGDPGREGRGAAQWRLCGRSRLYSCQADGEELTLPTRPLPRPPPAGLAHTLTRSAPLEPGQAAQLPAGCCCKAREQQAGG